MTFQHVLLPSRGRPAQTSLHIFTSPGEDPNAAQLAPLQVWKLRKGRAWKQASLPSRDTRGLDPGSSLPRLGDSVLFSSSDP